MENKAELAIIVPCYNEQEVLPQSIKTLTALRADLIKKELVSKSSKLVFVNDGSEDSTWDIISKEHDKKAYIKGICFSRNFGHQAALLAGLEAATGDAVISIDADMEQPPALIAG